MSSTATAAEYKSIYTKKGEWVNTGTPDGEIMVFHPTPEEFADFAKYVEALELRCVHNRCGVCKVRFGRNSFEFWFSPKIDIISKYHNNFILVEFIKITSCVVYNYFYFYIIFSPHSLVQKYSRIESFPICRKQKRSHHIDLPEYLFCSKICKNELPSDF